MSEIKNNFAENDELKLFYEIMIQSLKIDNVKAGLNKSLYLLKEFLDCDNIILYKKNYNNNYNIFIRIIDNNTSHKSITCIVNQTSKLVETKQLLNLDLSMSSDLNNLKLLHLQTKNCQYILAFNSNSSPKDLNPNFYNRLIETMQIILNRAEIHEQNTMAITKDLLSGVNNRNSYEIAIKKINEENIELVYGLFDLFRLKFVNDNYNHSLGDTYIKEVATILKKYWPQTENYAESIAYKGQNLYRIGGDEFALLTTKDHLELANIKANLAAEEVSMIDLGIKEKTPLGLNYGLVMHKTNADIKTTYINADKLMSENKRKMYVLHGLERRR